MFAVLGGVEYFCGEEVCKPGDDCCVWGDCQGCVVMG